MKTLILIRHGEAEPAYATSDFNRNLTLDGKAAVKDLGIRMNEWDIVPEIIVSSNANRTKQTSEGLLSQLKDPCGVQYFEALYNAPPAVLRSHIEDQSKHFNTLVVIAHNPGISILAGELSGQLVSFKPGEGIVLEIDLKEWELLSGSTVTQFRYL